MSKYYIYYHRDPRPEHKGWKRYIGKGSGSRAFDFKNRKAKHLHWIQKLEKSGLKPIVEIVENFDKESDAYKREKELIKKYRDLGYNLCNLTNGGEGGGGEAVVESNKRRRGERRCNKSRFGNKHALGSKRTPEQIKKMSEVARGNKNRARKIKCLNNNKIYESVKSASETLGLDNRSLHRVLKGEWSHTKGYKFKYI